MRFEFATATRVVFGEGAIEELPAVCAPFGKRALVVTGSTPQRWSKSAEQLSEAGLTLTWLAVAEEPSTPLAAEGAALAREAEVDFVVAIGGGSALDTGKAIAMLVANGGEPIDYLEVIGRGCPIEQPSVPFVAVPTTAGTGTEVTRNAVLYSPEHQVKVSLRAPGMLPRVALVDPAVTVELPPAVTASTGLDALTQVLEPFVSNAANPLTDAVCREGLTRSARSLHTAYHAGHDLAARTDMALVSLFGGLALANAGLGAAHGFAGPLGGMFKAPHGALCAAVLPAVMEVNLRVLRERAAESPALGRYTEVARLLTGDPEANAQDGASWIRSTCQELKVAPLSALGVGQQEVAAIVEKSACSSSMKGNPIALTAAELTEIIERSL